MPRARFTEFDVAKAIIELQSKKLSTSTESLIKHMGGGSKSTIGPMRKAFLSEQEKSAALITKTMQSLFSQVVSEAQTIAQSNHLKVELEYFKRLDELEAECKTLKTENAALRDAHQKTEAVNESLTHQNIKDLAELKAGKTQINSLLKDNDTLKKKLDKSEIETKRAWERLEQQRINDRARADELRRDFRDESIDLNNQITILKEQLKVLEKTESEQRTLIHEQMDQNARQSVEIESLLTYKSIAEDYKIEIANLFNEQKAKSNQIESLEAELREQESVNQKLNEQILEVSNKLLQSTQEVQTLRMVIDTLKPVASNKDK
jgi:DNA repair exonuclease SbcCD ATPase subunit